MRNSVQISFSILLLCPVLTSARLSVTVAPSQVYGQKVIVPLAMKNQLAEKVESARAAVFLLDEKGKVVGQNTQWVIGGTKDKPGLAPGATNVFNFVITASKPFAETNLTARVQFSRLILEGGKLADVTKQVTVEQAGN